MTGLEIEIEKRKLAKRSSPKERFSVGYISKLIGKPYQTTQSKMQNLTFDIYEMLGIFYTLIPQENRTMEMFEYLFTEQN